MLSEEKLREVFARNLTEYRRQSGMTQTQLAEKLNYSDKSVSKWERGEGMPDLPVAYKIAGLFGVTVNDLLREHKFKKPLLLQNKVVVLLLTIGIVWLVAAIVFFVLQLAVPDFRASIFYIYAVSASFGVAVVYSFMWWNKLSRFISLSGLLWTLCFCVVISIPVSKVILLYIIAAVLQVIIALSFLIRK